MTARMIDCLYPPSTAAQLTNLGNLTGAKMIALYVPGWGTPKVLDVPDPSPIAKIALSLGWEVVAILDPNHQPLPAPDALGVGHQMALDWLSGIGADPSGPGTIPFDLEAGDYASDLGLCRELAAAWFELDNGRSAQYGSSSGLANLADLPPNQRPERIWAANDPGTTTWPTSTAAIPGLPDGLWGAPGQRGWQFAGAVVSGVSVDFSVVDWPGFQPPAPAPAPEPSPEPPQPTTLAAGTYELPGGATLVIP